MYHRRMKKVLEKLKNEEFKKKVLLKESAFSRKQNMPFEDMVKFMIRDNKKSTSNELIDYFKLTNNIENTITKQAFSFQRQNISYEVFNLLNEEFIEEFYTEENYKTYHGYVVIGTDGTNIEIPNRPTLMTYAKAICQLLICEPSALQEPYTHRLHSGWPWY